MSSAYYTNEEVPWSTGLFDCFSDLRRCCISCWCPCITFGKIVDIVGKGETSSITSGGLYTVLSVFGGCQCLYSYVYRSKMRKEYNLEGSTAGDFMTHFCCEPCALTQEYNELKNRGFDMDLGWQGNMDKQNHVVSTAPVVESGMQK